MQMRMLARLGQETRADHPACDANRLALMLEPNPMAYRAFLVRVYGFEGEFEIALRAANLEELIMVRGDGTRERIGRDLAALGIDADALAKLPTFAFPRLQCAGALGWMFVIDRNALLHGLVVRHLARYLPNEIKIAGSYLSRYTSGAAGLRLLKLGPLLDQIEKHEGPEPILEGAIEAFKRQRQWYRAREPRNTGEQRAA